MEPILVNQKDNAYISSALTKGGSIAAVVIGLPVMVLVAAVAVADNNDSK